MDMFLVVLKCTVSMMISMVIGYACRKKNVITADSVGVLSAIMIYVVLPCKLFTSMQLDRSARLAASAVVAVLGFLSTMALELLAG